LRAGPDGKEAFSKPHARYTKSARRRELFVGAPSIAKAMSLTDKEMRESLSVRAGCIVTPTFFSLVNSWRAEELHYA
jgi:hypothetical protein